ncbi:hypothetical protein [Modestobacter marinus]|uniref:hypothetical protein n=1 Tax=Modestobacter marinus TaxID=477641 RepID=UPI001C953786|nr:hypothetical protein [Modestobacter marinus]
MFLNLAKLLGPARREQVFLVHPVQLSRWLDEAWQAAALVPPLPIGSVSTRPPSIGGAFIVDALDLPQQLPPASLLPSGIDLADVDRYRDQTIPPAGPGLLWHHLMYAYLIESTGALEVFAEVVRRLVVGETLGQLSPESVKWVRATEELFFRDPPLFSIAGVTSELRPQARVNRRNAYWRMFGFDLPHPIPARWAPPTPDTPWKADVGAGVNTDFRSKWSELLRQVWLGLEHFTNTSGAKPTDEAYIATLCRALADMLNHRRRGGLLAREEFAYVTTLSWFHLTLLSDTPIVADLKAQASHPSERLAMIAERVGLRPAQRARELFDLAEPMSSVLRAIEIGSFDDDAAAATLFDPNGALGKEMRDLINQWQSATGERIKERVTATAVLTDRQPLRLPTPGGTDGRRPVAPAVEGRTYAPAPRSGGAETVRPG